MTENIKILLAQINPVVGAIAKNCSKIKEIIQKEQEMHDILLFPELCLSGYPPEDLILRPAFLREIQKALYSLKEAVKDCHVIIGLPYLENGHCYNSAAVLHHGTIIALYHKQKLPNYGVFDEQRYFSAGNASCTFMLKNRRFGLCICEDLWQKGVVEQLVTEGIDHLLCINASPFDYTKYSQRLALLQKQSQKGFAVSYVNMVGGQDGIVFDGHSLVVDNQGTICCRLPGFCESLGSVSLGETISGDIAPLDDRNTQIYKALLLGTADYINKNGFPGVLLGLSGGIDSALTLAVAADALGAHRVKAVMMPSRYTAAMSLEDAKFQINALDISSETLSIEPAYHSFLQTLHPVFADKAVDITEQNIQARIRGTLLMALSNKSGHLVLTTSNKSETAVGYATLYGDMAGGFAVLKDVLKTQVYALARYRNQQQLIIPERVLSRAPSAELAPNQTDQDSLPSYAVLDAVIQGYMEKNQTAEELIAQGLPDADVHNIIRLITRNEYKRRQAAPGVKISPRDFGRDWRYPLTSGYLE